MTLRDEISGWDARSTDPLLDVYGRRAHERGFLARLISLMALPEFERAATWLIKHHIESGTVPPTRRAADSFYAHLPGLTSWEARLHALQSMHAFRLPASEMRRVQRFVESCMADENKFVRAWAYSGLHAIAAQHPRLQQSAAELFEDASQTDPAPAVRARARKLLRTPFNVAQR